MSPIAGDARCQSIGGVSHGSAWEAAAGTPPYSTPWPRRETRAPKIRPALTSCRRGQCSGLRRRRPRARRSGTAFRAASPGFRTEDFDSAGWRWVVMLVTGMPRPASTEAGAGWVAQCARGSHARCQHCCTALRRGYGMFRNVVMREPGSAGVYGRSMRAGAGGNATTWRAVGTHGPARCEVGI